MLSVTTWYNLFISLSTEGRLYVSQSLLLDSEELESDLSLEELLIESQQLLEAFSLIFFIFMSSWHEPDFLEMLKSIFFCFLRVFSSFFHLLSDFWYCFTASALLPTGPHSPSLMVFWLVCLPKQSSTLCEIYFCWVIPAFLKSMQWRWLPWCLDDFSGAHETIPKYCLILNWDPNLFVAVRYRGCLWRCNLLDMGCWYFPVIFNLDRV